MKNSKLSPNTARPATPKPITVPPPNDTFSAFGKLVFAASAVLAFASVAIRMPTFPARAEKNAPITNAIIIIQCVVSTSIEITPSAIAAMPTKTKRSRYSATRNAKAPSFIDLDILCILSSPGACFFTQAILTNINSRPKTANAIGTKIMFDSINYKLIIS